MRVVYGIGTGFNRFGKPIPDYEAENLIETATFNAARRFGGCFVQSGKGTWKDDSGNIVSETGITITVDGMPDDQIETFGEFLRKLFDQQSVIVSRLQSEVSFVSASCPQVERVYHGKE